MAGNSKLIERRKTRIRRTLKKNNVAGRPRLSVFRSSKNIYAQIIDDNNSVTVAAASSLEVDLKKSVALVFGTEQYGLSDFWMKNSNILVKIPMYGKADSLNVAGATTILLYETIRQRKLS